MNSTLSAPTSTNVRSSVNAAVSTPPALKPLLVRNGQGRVIRAFGDEVTVLMGGRDTAGAYTAFLNSTPPGGGPPPHRHHREDEWFYVLEGCVSFFIAGGWKDAKAGEFVFAPRGSVHTFKNNTAEPTLMLIHTSPSGFEDFFAEAAEEFVRPGGPDMGRAIAIAGRHGIEFVQP
jgi:quercetin dioxygenase-like cupin family protein